MESLEETGFSSDSDEHDVKNSSDNSLITVAGPGLNTPLVVKFVYKYWNASCKICRGFIM